MSTGTGHGAETARRCLTRAKTAGRGKRYKAAEEALSKSLKFPLRTPALRAVQDEIQGSFFSSSQVHQRCSRGQRLVQDFRRRRNRGKGPKPAEEAVSGSLNFPLRTPALRAVKDQIQRSFFSSKVDQRYCRFSSVLVQCQFRIACVACRKTLISSEARIATPESAASGGSGFGDVAAWGTAT